MCTSFTFQSKNDLAFLARTMDFEFLLKGKPTFTPRNQVFNAMEKQAPAKFAILGTARYLKVIVDNYVFIDGMNEKGLMGAVLYLPGIATYAKEEDSTKVNLAPHQVLNYLLANYESLEDIQNHINEINIVDFKWADIKITPPFHWILSDKTGNCLVIEPLKSGELNVTMNPVGVLTNSPELDWHLKNLSNYVTLDSKPGSSTPFGSFTKKAWGVGANTIALPGGFIPADRFVRATYLKQNYAPTPKDEGEALNAVIHILNQVDIPKGVDRVEKGFIEFSQYKAIMCGTNLTYFFIPYGNQTVHKVTLNDKLLNSSEPKVFEFEHKQEVVELN